MVYLLHFDKPINSNHKCQHYLGFTKHKDTAKRLKEHKSGNGARLTQVANERGIDYTIVYTWNGGRELERKLKNRKNSPKLCPVCNSKEQYA